MFLELCLWTLNQGPWIACVLVLLEKYSDLIISCSAKMELVTTRLKGAILRELSLLILFLMLFEKKLRTMTACRGCKFFTH